MPVHSTWVRACVLTAGLMPLCRLVGNGQILLLAQTLVTALEQKPTASYPTLNVLYEFHTLDAVAEGLPAGPFVTSEEKGGGKVRARALGIKPIIGTGLALPRVSLPGA